MGVSIHLLQLLHICQRIQRQICLWYWVTGLKELTPFSAQLQEVKILLSPGDGGGSGPMPFAETILNQCSLVTAHLWHWVWLSFQNPSLHPLAGKGLRDKSVLSNIEDVWKWTNGPTAFRSPPRYFEFLHRPLILCANNLKVIILQYICTYLVHMRVTFFTALCRFMYFQCGFDINSAFLWQHQASSDMLQWTF